MLVDEYEDVIHQGRCPLQRTGAGKTYKIRIGPHKRKCHGAWRPSNVVQSARHHEDAICNHQLPGLFPQHHRAPREVTARLDHFHLSTQEIQLGPSPENLLRTAMLHTLGSEADISLDMRPVAHDPLLVLDGVVHGTVKGPGPLDRRGEVVRMRDGDGADPAQLVDATDRVVVNVCDAVPEHVAPCRTTQDGALAQADGGHGDDAHDARVVLGHGEVVVVFFGLLQGAQRRPPLSVCIVSPAQRTVATYIHTYP